jgi:uncharacterized protein
MILGGSCPAQNECRFGGQDAFNELAGALRQENSCQKAAQRMHDCAWGSSADTQLAPIVISKCEKTFFSKLSAAGKERYEDEMQLCAYEYSKAQGTISMSAAALCQLDIATTFAADPSIAERPLAHVGVDCEKAGTSLDKAICSDKRLGHADIVLSRVYLKFFTALPKEPQSALAESQHQWLKKATKDCDVSDSPLSLAAKNCIATEYENRFTDLGTCLDSPEEQNPADCLKVVASDREADEHSEAGGKVRASFDCENPKLALELAICADSGLGQKDIELSEAYAHAIQVLDPNERSLLTKSEKEWLQYVQKTCPMGAVGGIPPVLTRSCIRTAFETRATQLNECVARGDRQHIECLNHFSLW